MSRDARALVEAVHREVVRSGAGDAESTRRALLDREPLLGEPDIESVVSQVVARVDGLGPIAPLLEDATVDEVMINGGGAVWVERHGRLQRTSIDVDEHTTLLILERIVAPLGLRIDRSSPIVDARLADGSRVHGIVPPLAIDGPCVTIRRFGATVVPLERFAPPAVVRVLRAAVRARMNVLVSGGSGAGKTTLLNALASEIEPHERVVTIEDAAELRLPGEHVIRLEARPANAEGIGEVRVRELVRTALRMRPDRVIVGEVRGPETIDMLQAMNTGHVGSLSTCHANGPADALRRLETLALLGDASLPHAAVREQVRSAIDLVVHVSRHPDGSRSITSLAEPPPDEQEHSGISRLWSGSGAVERPVRRARWSSRRS